MKLKDRITTDMRQAMKDRDFEKKLILSTLLGELDRSSKNPSDDVVIGTIKKLVEANKLTGNEHENLVLETYLPKMMSDDELAGVIAGYVDGGIDNIGSIMKLLKSEHAGMYDGRVASEIAKKTL